MEKTLLEGPETGDKRKEVDDDETCIGDVDLF